MAITFFGVATTPADNSASAGPTVTLTPPASMQDGDLVVVYVKYRDSAATISDTPSNTGGQSWNLTTQYNTTNIRARVFWCRFNGTWSANPAFTVTSGTNNMDAQMLVFRPTSATYTWTLEAGPTSATYSAPAGAVSITGRNTTAASTVSIGAWHSVDDNSWGNLSGTGWSKTSLTAQYRNNSTNDNSSSYAYRIMTSSGATNNVSQEQTALGGDAGSTSLMTFAETLITAAITGVAATAAAGSLAISNIGEGLAGVAGTATAAEVSVVAGADDDSTSLTGVAATAGVGSVTVNIGASPGGVASTASAGSLASAVTVVGIAGVSATADAGTAAIGDQIGSTSPSGVSASASAGTISVAWTAIIAPTGVGVGGAVGTLLPLTGAFALGVSSTATAGTATGIGSVPGTVPVSGVVSSLSAGSLASVLITEGIAGVSAAASAGTITASAGGVSHGAGQAGAVSATAQVGELAALTLQHVQGVVATLTAETISSGVLVAEIDGVESVVTAANLAPLVASPITGVSASGSVGAISVFGTVVQALSGVQAIATVGNLTGVTAGTGAAAIGGVQASAEVGTLQAGWNTLVSISGVQSTTAANDVAVEAGDTVPDEVSPAGVAATVQLGVLSTGEARAAPTGIFAQAIAGTLGVSTAIAQPLDRPDSITVVPALEATVSVESVMTADLVRVTPQT